MGILSGGRKTIVTDKKKELTVNAPIITISDPDTVYIPIVNGINNQFDLLVETGDKVLVGTKLAIRKDNGFPILSTVSGTVDKIEKLMHTTQRLQTHILISNDHQNSKLEMEDLSIIETMKEYGLLGLGGSGFPTFIKYQNANNIDTILINAAECEPYISAGHVEILENFDSFFDGINLMMEAANAKKAIVAFMGENAEMLSKVKARCLETENIDCVEIPVQYAVGWERLLIRKVLKKEYNNLPSEIGVIVNNASTAIYLSQMYRNHNPICRRIVTVTGDGIKNPTNVDVLVGTRVDHIIEEIGGYADLEEGIIIHGGPMMGTPMNNDQFCISPHTNGLVVVENDKTKETVPCLKCGKCIDGCPAFLQPVRIMQAYKANNIDLMRNLKTDECVQCGICTYVCPSRIEVSDFVLKAKRAVNIKIGGNIK